MWTQHAQLEDVEHRAPRALIAEPGIRRLEAVGQLDDPRQAACGPVRVVVPAAEACAGGHPLDEVPDPLASTHPQALAARAWDQRRPALFHPRRAAVRVAEDLGEDEF